jgi:hypothetical protein
VVLVTQILLALVIILLVVLGHRVQVVVVQDLLALVQTLRLTLAAMVAQAAAVVVALKTVEHQAQAVTALFIFTTKE